MALSPEQTVAFTTDNVGAIGLLYCSLLTKLSDVAELQVPL